MNKVWEKRDIEKVILELNKYFQYNCKIPVEISSRATKRMGAFFYKKEYGIIIPMKFVFAKSLLDGRYSEEIVREVIVHEYIHYYCDTKTGVSNGHNKLFKAVCRKAGISDERTFKYNSERMENKGKEYKIYCSKCNKLVCIHKRKDAAERKINEYISKCCRSSLYLKV